MSFHGIAKKQVTTLKPKLKNKDFNPSLTYPLYIIRKNIYRGILKHSESLEGRMMDFGCGTKPYKPLFVNAKEYIGVDYAGEGHSHEKESIDVMYDGKTIPFPDNHFDSILTTEVLEHIFNLEDILKELNRVLKPGGRILITIPFAWNEHEMPNDFGRYTSLGFRSLLERNNFKVLQLEKTTGFVESLVQLWGLYWHIHIIPKFRPFGRIILPVFSFCNNVFGLAIAKILPRKNDYFLNLVILATKE
jgi:SAM-dependent methyltransferase